MSKVTGGAGQECLLRCDQSKPDGVPVKECGGATLRSCDDGGGKAVCVCGGSMD